MKTTDWLETDFNPDCFVEYKELSEYRMAIRQDREAIDATYGEGTSKLLIGYCLCRELSMRARRIGNIAEAMRQDAICDRIYNSIPKSIRW